MLDRLSLVIAIWPSSPERLRNVILVTDYLARVMPEVRVILVELNHQPQLSELACHRYLCIRRHRDEEFPKAAMLNAGVALCTTEYVGMYDADVIIPRVAIETAVKGIADGQTDAVIPARDWHWMHPDQRVFDRVKITYDGNLAPTDDMVEATMAGSGGALIMRRWLYNAVGGYCNEFVGWAPEDQELVVRLGRLGYSVAEVKSRLYHLPHPRAREGENYLRETPNEPMLKLFDDILKLDGDATAKRFGAYRRVILTEES